ncbi:hypothetical protein O4H49_03140 [Kiloniella laminariae]|uniref:Uncharacterized protein n=1 Tax=Kiloniella laminariae TaxID=454162 RepID=A0ABT4LF78_9PROT|nr:hypothetical protein [Kiloniella laminariae]MCZ4279758.1 hypothetical protein [Kiloniella laminariae]
MSFVFRFFLLFCSRNFRDFYIENERQGLIDSRARLNYFLLFFFWFCVVALALLTAVLFVKRAWELYTTPFLLDELTEVFALLLIAGTLYSHGRRKIRQLEKSAFIYSAGAVAVSVLVDKVSHKGGKDNHSYRYEVEGKPYWLECDYAGERNIGDKAPVIFVQNLPKTVCLYDPSAFRRNCLIRDKPEPGQVSGWDLDGHLAEAEKPQQSFVSPGRFNRNDPPWKQE